MLPHYTKTFHHTPYPAISPTLPALSTSGKVVVITGGGSGLGPSIASSFAQSGPEADFLRGKFIWANWDVEELKAKKEELINSPQLTFGLLGWP
jgi:hypothetical protein